LKIKFFLCQMFNNKLQVSLSLTRRGWKGAGKCCLCGGLESVDHIFSTRFVWSIIKEVVSMNNVRRSLNEFSETWLQGKGPLTIFF
jgi:hypothetical protein